MDMVSHIKDVDVESPHFTYGQSVVCVIVGMLVEHMNSFFRDD